jgi:hypothetical protein
MRSVRYWLGGLAIAYSLVFVGGCDSRVERKGSAPAAIVDRQERDRRLHSHSVEIPSRTRTTAVCLEHKPLRDSKDPLWIIPSVVFSPDNRFVITYSCDVARFWRIGDFREQFHVKKSLCNSIWFSPDGQSFLIASDEHTLCLRSITDGQIIRHLPSLREKIVKFSGFSLDGKTVFLLALENRFVVVSLNDLTRGSLVLSGAEIPTQQERYSLPAPVVHSSGRAVVRTDWTPTTSWKLRSLDLKSGKTSRTFSDNADHTFGMRFSNDGVLLGVCESTLGEFTGSWFNKWIRLFDYESGKQLWSWHDKTNWRCDLVDVAFSPNNTTFATADRLLVRLWDFAAGQEILRLEHDESSLISSIAYSPDGERLAVATLDGPVWIWPLTPPQWKAAAQPLDRPSISSLWTQLAATDDAPLPTAQSGPWPLPPRSCFPSSPSDLFPFPNTRPSAFVR